MRVLVTGDRGAVGVGVAGFLTGWGYQVAGFDRADGADVLHPAALAGDSAGSPEQIMAVNVLSTWHVLLAAEAAGVTGGGDLHVQQSRPWAAGTCGQPDPGRRGPGARRSVPPPSSPSSRSARDQRQT